MEKIYLFNYNNYVNRIIRGHETLAGYLADVNADLITTTGIVNFNKKDEKEASIVVTLEVGQKPDYLIVVDEDTNTIMSRWFVLNETRGNYNSYTLDLKRDLVYDNLSDIVNNRETLIKRGVPNGSNESSILNKENFNFNAYKQKEIFIDFQDEYHKAWVAIFIGNKIKGKVDVTDPRYSIYLSGESSKFYNAEVNFDGEYGYSIILLPYEIISKINDYNDYKVVFGSGNIIEVEGVSITKTGDLEVISINKMLTNYILDNPSFIDVQIIPDYINGFDYEIDDDNKTITITRTVGFNSGYCLFKYDGEDENNNTLYYYTKFPIIYNPIQELTKTITVDDIVGNDFDDLIGNDFIGIKKLERIKCYLQSPDRSTSKEIDLRYFYKGTTKVESTDTFDFEIKCTFQPFQSFISVAPESGKWFGSNTNDGQYLICGYNNQLLRTTDAWINFLLSNKNYLNSFNLEMRDSYINTITGTATGAIGGATAGAMAGSVIPVLGTAVGAVAGAVIGGGASLVQGLVNTEEKRKQFEWTCDNIKSQPQSVSKVASFVNTNCIYPVLIVCYNTNDNFNDYLKLNNSTVSRIGAIAEHCFYSTLPDYNYIVAEIIRLKSFKGTADELLEIQNELERGLYFEVDM